MKKILLIIPTYNAKKHIIRCLDHIYRSLSKVSGQEFITEIVIVDDRSTDDTVGTLRKNGFESIIIGTGNLWWSGSVNKGVELACKENYEYILLLNSDNFVAENFFVTLYDCLRQKPESIVGSVVYDEHGIPFFRGCNIDAWGQFTYIKELTTLLTPCDIFGGMGVAVPISVVREIGLFDQEKLPLYFGDTDFWVRCKKKRLQPFICNELKIQVDAKNTGTKAKGNKVIFFLKNMLNRKFHANIVSVSKFYLNNFTWVGLPVFVFLFYFNYMVSSSRKSF